MRRWTEQDLEDLKLGLSLNLTHEEIGDCLGRTKSSVMHKVQKENLSSSSVQWFTFLTKEEVLSFIRTYKTASALDYTDGVPGHKTCQKILKVSSWAECLELAGLPNYKKAKFDENKPTTFYIVSFNDLDGTSFNKFGITQRSIQERYSLKDINIINQVVGSLEYCQDLEKKFETAVKNIKYLPKDKRFYDSNRFGGYTECYKEK